MLLWLSPLNNISAQDRMAQYLDDISFQYIKLLTVLLEYIQCRGIFKNCYLATTHNDIRLG